MARIEKTIEIKASPEEIWPLISLEKIAAWMRQIKKTEYASNERKGVGTIVHVWGKAGGVKCELEAETTDWTEYRSLAWRSVAGTLTGFGSVTLIPSQNGTIATFTIDYDLPYCILGKVVDKLRVYKALEKGFTLSLEKLKATLESAENKK